MHASDLFRVLAEAQNREGGWGYQRASPSRIEPTSWALLAALDGGSDPSSDDRSRGSAVGKVDIAAHGTFLARCQGSESLLAEHPHQPPNIAFNNMAALVALGTPGLLPAAQTRKLISALVDLHGVGLPDAPELQQDNGLRGWPWTDGAFSWVEPTSWGVMVMKKLRRLAKDPAHGAEAPPDRLLQDRIDEAEKMLIDRCCANGGWNYGNRHVFGQDLRPYVSTTAIALMALQDRRDHPSVARSVAYLRDQAESEPTGMALSLAVIALRLLGQDTAAIEARLAAEFERTQFLGLVHVTAMAAYAVSWAHHEGHAFRV